MDLFDMIAELDEAKDTLNHLEATNNVDLLDNQEKEPEIILRTPETILNDYTKLDLDNQKLELQIEEFKAEHAEIFKVLEDIQAQMNINNDKQAELKEELTETLGNLNQKNVVNDRFKVTYVAATKKSTFDRKGFETKYPVLCKQFLKYSDVKAYIKISEVKK